MPKRRVTRANAEVRPPLVPTFEEAPVVLKNARDLAALLRANPALINELNTLDESQWVKPPEELLQAARGYNLFRVGDNGSYVVGEP